MKYRPSEEGEEILKQDYRKKIIFSLKDFDEKGHLLQVVIIPPHMRQRLHSHQVQTEVFYILEGESIITIDGIEHPAGPGDAFICSPGEIHNVWNQTDQDFKVLVFKINLPEDEEDSRWLE